jgi:hypothetical protein
MFVGRRFEREQYRVEMKFYRRQPTWSNLGILWHCSGGVM